jgi:hypothetical protein
MLHLSRSLNTSTSRCLMAGLACGILAAVLNAVYTYIYGNATNLSHGMLLSPVTFFIGVPILFLAAGFIFFEMVEYIKKGRFIFSILFLLLTALATMIVLNMYEGAMEGFVAGLIIINGLLISLLLPYLATHAKLFMDRDEYSESADV